MIEVIYRWQDGREEVRYRRPEGSDDAHQFAAAIEKMIEKQGDKCPYSIRRTSTVTATQEKGQ